jgi:hypothetical protein
MFANWSATVRIALLVIALFFGFRAWADGTPQAPTKQLEVVIISVENFDDPTYQNPLLQLNIQKAADQLINFFSQRFPMAQITVLRTRDETTSAHLAEFFKGTFPGIANGNMALLFVLSHGEALPSPNPVFGSDLRIVASDTPASNIPGKTISLSTDVLGNIGGLLPGSFVFGFIDTCHGGAASNIGLSIDAALKNALGVKTMLMASSLSDQLAFQASFTQALVKIWNSPSSSTQAGSPAHPCTLPEVSVPIIRDQIQNILGTSLPLGQTDGYPTVLIHFQGTMCLETFAAQSAIVDIINGTPDTYVASFTDASGLQFNQPIEGHDAVPIRLSRAMYNFVVYRNNLAVTKPKSLDLRTTTFDWEPVGAPDTHQVGMALEQGALAAESVGADPTDVQNTLRLSYGAYVIAKDMPSAERVAQVIDAHVGSDWFRERLVAFQPTDAIRSTLIRNGDAKELGSAADQLQRFGNVGSAADLFAEAAAKAKEENSGESSHFATEAYLGFSAAGEYDRAKGIRQSYKLALQDICSDCKQLEVQAIKGNLHSAQTLGNVTTLQMLLNLSTADEQAKAATK